MKESIHFDHVRLHPSQQIGLHQQPTWELSIMVLIAESKERYAIGRRTYETEAEQRLKQIEIFISCNYKRDVTIADIAQHVGMNRSSLCIFYHRQTGKTLVAALTEHRLSVAQHLLRHSSLTIQQVCYECGFNDVPHFCRIFKRMFLVTPKEFRKQE